MEADADDRKEKNACAQHDDDQGPYAGSASPEGGGEGGGVTGGAGGGVSGGGGEGGGVSAERWFEG